MHRIFVYGTLRRGEPNAPYLERAVPIAPARTAPRFTLLDAGAYPAATDHGQTALVGDVYGVDTETFAALDSLEGYPVFYSRRVITTTAGDAWIYLWVAARNRHWPVIESGDWPAYRRRRDRTEGER